MGFCNMTQMLYTTSLHSEIFIKASFKVKIEGCSVGFDKS